MYSTLISTYLKNDPRRGNPFNQPTHDFSPSDDPEADNMYLRGVRAGTISRFYVTVVESIRPGHLQAVIIDRHNSNQVATFTPRQTSFAAQYGDYEAKMLPMLELLRQIGSEQRVEVSIDEDHAAVSSGHGANMLDALRTMFARDKENVVDNALFAEGVAAAQANQSPDKLWHFEQLQGFFSVKPSLATAGAGD